MNESDKAQLSALAFGIVIGAILALSAVLVVYWPMIMSAPIAAGFNV